MNYLNLGCGKRFHPAWTNVDFISTDTHITSCNLLQGIPYPNLSFDVVYNSHLLEHFPKSYAEIFLKECYRVLQSKGILRIVVPDLEQIVRTYIVALEQASRDVEGWVANYEWILLELYDQSVRNQSGGEMASYLFSGNIINHKFIIERIGTEAKRIIEAGQKHREQAKHLSPFESSPKQFLKRIYQLLRCPDYRKELFLKLLLGQEYEALQIGRFRLSGEVHQWMYDRFSLTSLLKQCGFEKITQQTATTSFIPNWADFRLDTEPDGSVYKPDSIFMEAIKP